MPPAIRTVCFIKFGGHKQRSAGWRVRSSRCATTNGEHANTEWRYDPRGRRVDTTFHGDAALNAIKLRILCLTAAILACACVLSAQQSKGAAPAPVPGQIAAAQTVFIANAGGASLDTVIDQTVFDGGPDRPYNDFYAAMKGWGRYQIVPSPASADLVFEISWVLSDTGLKLPVLGQLRLLIIDPKTHVMLWNITEYVRGALLLGNRDKNFVSAMNTVVSRMKLLATPASTAAN